MHPGDQLREMRTRLKMSTRDVASWSVRIAAEEKQPEFEISNSWLTQLENKQYALPSFYKLFSLASIYRVSYGYLLKLFGVDLSKVPHYQAQIEPDATHLARLESFGEHSTVSLPVRFDAGLNLNRTNLLSRMIETWGEVPLDLIRRLDIRTRLYGFVGLEDFTLFPLLRPGSFVQIDPQLKRVSSGNPRSEYERPIYFIDLRDEYVCAWCELTEGKLFVLSHPLSPCQPRCFPFPGEAEIVGRVTGVAMQLAENAERPRNESSGLPI